LPAQARLRVKRLAGMKMSGLLLHPAATATASDARDTAEIVVVVVVVPAAAAAAAAAAAIHAAAASTRRGN
jgi:hypothetical protein